MKFEDRAKEEKVENRVNLNDLPLYKLFIGETTLNLNMITRYKSKKGPWVVVVTEGGMRVLINLSSGITISESLDRGYFWSLPRSTVYIINPVEVEGAVIRIPQKYLELLK